jgi:WD40 repeat protein
MGAAVWDTETGKRLHAFAPALDDAPQAVAFSADGKSIAVGYNKKIEVWTGGKMQPKNLGDQGLVTALAFTPDGTQLAAGIRLPIFHGGEKPPRVTGHKSEVRLIDLATDKVVKVFDGFEGVNHLAATKLPVSAIAFSRDGKKLLAGTGYRPGKSLPAVPKEPIRGEVKLWDIAAPDPAPAAQKWQDAAILTDHGTLVDSVAFAPDGKTFAVGGPGGDAANTVTVWDTATRKQVWKGGVFPAGVTAVAYNPDGTLLAATRDKVTGFFNPKNGESVLMNPPFPGGRALAFSPDGGRIAVSDGKKTTVRDTGQKGGKNEFKSVIDATDGPFPAAVAWSKDGKYLAVPYHEPISGEYAVDVYDVAAEKAKPLAGHPGRVTAVAWSKDGKLIVSGDQKGTVIAWDADARKELWRKAFKGRDDTIGRVNAIAISPADNTVAVAVSMGSGKGPERVVLLAPADGKDVDHLMRPWSVPVSSVAWSKDGTLLITGCGSAGRPVNQDESAVGEVVIWERKP